MEFLRASLTTVLATTSRTLPKSPACLQEPEQYLPRAVEALRAEIVDLREWLEAVEGRTTRGRGSGEDHGKVEVVDAGDYDTRQRSVVAPRRVFPELITAEAEPGEAQIHRAAAELVVVAASNRRERILHSY
jgi:hypothetical protein